MSLRLRKPVLEAVIEEHPIREGSQRVVESRVPRRFLLLSRGKQFVFQHLPFSHFLDQRPVYCRQVFGAILNFAFDRLAFLKRAFDTGL